MTQLIKTTKKIYLKENFNWIIHTAAYHKIKDFESKPKLKAKKNILMFKNLIKSYPKYAPVHYNAGVFYKNIGKFALNELMKKKI